MNRVGRLLICIAGALTLTVNSRADSPVAPPVAPTPNVPNLNALRQRQEMSRSNLMNRIELMRKHHHAQALPPGLPQFPSPAQMPQMPQAGQAKVPALTPTPLSIVDSATAKDAPAKSDSASTSDNPYQSIVTRNVFGLNPIPPSVPQTQPAGPPPPKITLTGITTIFGPAEALFKVAGVVRNAGPPKEESYIFTEGEAQDDVEVTKIDTEKNVVTFMNHGVQQQIALADGVASGGNAPSSAPSWPGQNNFGRFGTRRLPPALQEQMRQRQQGFGGGNGFNPNGYNPNGGVSPSGYSGGYNNNYGAAANPASNLSADDQAALIAAERAATADPVLKNILPPTPQYDDQAKSAMK